MLRNKGRFVKGEKLSEEIKNKMKGRIAWSKGKKCPQLSGDKNGFYGKTHSPETLKKNGK